MTIGYHQFLIAMWDCAVCIYTSMSVLARHPQAGKSSDNTSGQSSNQGWYNRFVQTGRSESETKTNGAFGGLQVVCGHACCSVVGHTFSMLTFHRPY